MNSSISSSEDAAKQASQWRAWLAILGAAPIAFGVLYLLTVLLDPYSTGRFTFLERIDLASRHRIYAHAARVRDPDFNAAIIGNSHALAFDPGRLSAATGLRFVQLSEHGLNAREELTIAAAFARHHRGSAPTIVIILDRYWCWPTDAVNRISGFFPAYLFESSAPDYLRNIFSARSLRTALYRAMIILGFARDRQRRDGYAPPAHARPWTAQELERLSKRPRSANTHRLDAPLPALAQLADFASKLEAQSRLVLLFARTPAIELPAPGSAADKRLQACKARFRDFAASRPHTVLLDQLVDDAFAHDLTNFADTEHLHRRHVPEVERMLAAALAPMLKR